MNIDINPLPLSLDGRGLPACPALGRDRLPAGRQGAGRQGVRVKMKYSPLLFLV